MKDNDQTYISVKEALILIQSQIKDTLPYAIKTGFNDMDLMTKGFVPGELCIIGGLPAMGKTAFVLTLISHMVCKEIPVGLFTATDYLNVDFMSRIVSAVKNIDIHESYEEKLKNIQDAVLDEVPLYLNFEPRISIRSFRENAVKLKEEKDIKCLFVETIQSLFTYEENGSSKESIQAVCRELKKLAQELNIPIIVTSELNWSPEQREGIDGKYPQLCDLQYGNSIERYADLVLLLYRPEYYHIYQDERGYDQRGVLTVVVAKNKYGSIGDFRLKYDPRKCMFISPYGSVLDKEERRTNFKHLLQENEAVQMLSDNLGLEFVNDNICPF